MNAIPAIGTPPYPGARFKTTRDYQTRVWQREHPHSASSVTRQGGTQTGRLEEPAAAHNLNSPGGAGQMTETAAWFASA